MVFEGILTNSATEILKKLVPVVAQEISLAWGVKDELKKLQDTLEMILLVIADAERKQLNDAAIGLWLRRLKDVAYDANDVMNEYCYETMRRSVRGNNLMYKARDFVSSSNPLAFRFKMDRKIKHINQRLDGITKDMSSFQLQITSATSTAIPPGESSEQRSRQTASSINESDIFGREDDKKSIIDLLTKFIPSSSLSTSSDSNLEKVSVVSIVGMGGLGKTTLAQLVYKDELVNKQFELTMWVHVSEYFDVEKLLTKIMESSTRNGFDTLSNFDVLVS
ncbi:putative disease resistance protein RGA1 [Papaver somniferum]|uniref:putative disease resistance protein RGA1 n=1 Tax=Papaver somniferum TaxID=3469 RepID=UPI000E6FEF3A|nr:putative disease resistance protein RGA1 [Papaver somniferum]